MSLDLKQFVESNREQFFEIAKPVALEAVGALTARAGRPVLFSNIDGFQMPLVDGLFIDRAAQARVLGCAPDEVLRTMNAVLARGPKSLKQASDASCKEIKLSVDDVALSLLPIVTHTDKDPFPYTTAFAVHHDPQTGNFNSMPD